MLPGMRPPLAGLFPGVIEVTLGSSVNNLTISTLFSSGDWSGPLKKRLIIPAGIVIGSTSPGSPALRTGTGRGGGLEIVNKHQVLGAGGSANSGVGGDAFIADQSVTISGSGIFYAGGGGGGRGGTGGNGTYINTVREDLAYSTISRVYTGAYDTYFFWNSGSAVHYEVTPYLYTWYDGSVYTYNAGVSQGGGNYAIYRTHPVPTGTSGGAGGNGGRGYGYDGANAVGSGGAAGGTNAGTGGTGGTGGNWGAAGSTGATGASGNNGAGSGGTAGGAAGCYWRGNANITNLFSGGLAGNLA